MNKELKSCPFCGKEVEFIPAHFEGSWSVNPPMIHCATCNQRYEGAVVSISSERIYGEVAEEDFANDMLISWWNKRA